MSTCLECHSPADVVDETGRRLTFECRVCGYTWQELLGRSRRIQG